MKKTKNNVPTVRDVADFLTRRCRLDAAWAEDNVGLLAGEPKRRVRQVMLCLDLSTGAIRRHPKADLIVCYHPPIYKPISRLLDASPVYDAIRAGASLFSPHTGLDVADGGTSDVMAERLGLVDCRPIAPAEKSWTEVKLVVFCPVGVTEKVREAVCAAGAGGVGNYSQCAFRVLGRGSFKPGHSSNPAIGQRGRLEFVEEDRLEVLVPKSRLHEVLTALRKVHPYEEPAFDVVPLLETNAGIGRIGRLKKPVSGQELGRMAARAFGVKAAYVAGLTSTAALDRLRAGPTSKARLEKIAVFPGAPSGMIQDVVRSGAEALVTGELRHHEARELSAAGMVSVCVGHGASERPVLQRVGAWIRGEFPQVRVAVDDREAEPFAVVGR